MNVNLLYILIAGFVAYGIYSEVRARKACRLDVEEKLERLGLEPVDIKVGTSSGLTRGSSYYTFRFTARRPGEEEIYDGFGHFNQERTKMHLEWCDVNPSKARSWFGEGYGGDDGAATRAPRISQADELAIRKEVTARLDLIAQTPGAMLEHDVDGSGHVDALEWEALRAKIRAEVEAERGISPTSNVAPLSTKPPGAW